MISAPSLDYHTRPSRLTDASLIPGDSVDLLSAANFWAVILDISCTLRAAVPGSASFTINAHEFFAPAITDLAPIEPYSFHWTGWLPWDEHEHLRISTDGSTDLSYAISGFIYTI